MTAHVFNRALDSEFPATLSRATLTGLLRGELGFDGPVVTDDLRMGAIEQRWGLETAAVTALAAGADILLIANERLPDRRSAAPAAPARPALNASPAAVVSTTATGSAGARTRPSAAHASAP